MSAPGLTTRRLGPEDLGAVRELWREAGLPFKDSGRDAPDNFRRELEETRNFLIGAWDDGELVAVVLGTDEGRKGWVNRLAVRPANRGRGLGRELVRRCEEEFGRRGVGLVCALIEDGSEASMELFGAEGYVRRDDIHYFRKEIGPPGW